MNLQNWIARMAIFCLIAFYNLPFANADTKPSKDAAPKKVTALLLGIDDYGNKLPTLRYAQSDAAKLAQALKSAGATTTVFTPTGATTQQDFLFTLTKVVGEQKANETLIVFLAGHGGERDKAPVFLLPPSADNDQPDSLALTDTPDSVLNIMSQAKGDAVLIIDACRAPLSRSGAATMFPRGFSSSFVRGISIAVENAEATPTQQRAVLFSCSSGEYSYESDLLQGGAFTMSLVDSLKTGQARLANGSITASSLLSQSAGSVFYSQRGQQNPAMYGSATIIVGSGSPRPNAGTHSDVAAAARAFRGGDFRAAAAGFEKAAAADDPLALAFQGRSLVALGEAEKGFGLLRLASRQDADSIEIHLTFCDAILDFMEQPQTRNEAEKGGLVWYKPYWNILYSESVAALKINPNDVEALAYKAYSQLGLSMYLIIAKMSGSGMAGTPYKVRNSLGNEGMSVPLGDDTSFANAGKTLDQGLALAPDNPLLCAVKALHVWCSATSDDGARRAIVQAVNAGFPAERLANWLFLSASFVEDVVANAPSKPANGSNNSPQETQNGLAATSESIPAGAWLGLIARQDKNNVLLVQWVAPNSSLQGKVNPGDQLISIDQTTISDPQAIRNLLEGKAPGAALTLNVKRGKQQFNVPATLVQGPASPQDHLCTGEWSTDQYQGQLTFYVDAVAGTCSGVLSGEGLGRITGTFGGVWKLGTESFSLPLEAKIKMLLKTSFKGQLTGRIAQDGSGSGELTGRSSLGAESGTWTCVASNSTELLAF